MFKYFKFLLSEIYFKPMAQNILRPLVFYNLFNLLSYIFYTFIIFLDTLNKAIILVFIHV